MRAARIALAARRMACAAPSAAQDAAAMPGWMSGCWQWREGERWGEECWTIPRAGQMLGSARSGNAVEVSSWEFMRIERGDEGLRFVASPGGAGWTAFAATTDPADGATFVNPANDYPQRVRYWREGERLRAEISRLDGTDAVSWSFVKAGG